MQNKKNDNKKNKKEILLDTLQESKFIKNKIVIMSLLEENKLDSIINNITNREIVVLGGSYIKKDKISHSENFLFFLDSFINYIMNIINNYSIIIDVIVECLKNKESSILLEKIYPYDDNNLSKIRYNYRLMIISNFYYNLNIFGNEIPDIFNINTIDITKEEDIDKLINILEEMCFINKDNYYLLALFTRVEEDNYDIYLSYYERLLDNYIKNIDFVKEYQNFKKLNNIYL